MSTKTTRRSSLQFDQWRAAMLRGDALRTLPDKDREWVMRTLLKGVRREQAVRLAGVDEGEVARALVRVHRWYEQRVDAYKRRIALEAQQPKVVRPVVPAPVVQRRGWWPFSRSS